MCTGKRKGAARQAANGRASGQRWRPRARGDAGRERDDQRDGGGRRVRAQRLGDSQPAEQRQRAGCHEQERGDPLAPVRAHEQAGETGAADQRVERGDHEPSPGVIPARLVTSRIPAISATLPPTGGTTRTL